MFTCPFTGTYYIFVPLMKHKQDYIDAAVYKNNNTLLMHMKDTDAKKPWNTGSNSVLVHCRTKEYIHGMGFGPGQVFCETEIALSTFTVINVHNGGFSLKKIEYAFSRFTCLCIISRIDVVYHLLHNIIK